LSKNCFGQEKINRLLEEFPDRRSYKLIAYGDSSGDKELIDFADKGFYNKFV
jgi:phosphoserine phosphatase